MSDQAWQRTRIEEDDWIRGGLGAPVTLLEYGDFECPSCAVTHPVLRQLSADLGDIVRVVFRHFPVTSLHPHAAMAAEASEVAGAQGRFWEMHDTIFANQPDLEYDDLRWCAELVGCDLRRFDADMAAHRYLGEVKRDFRRGISDGVNGTPSLFINGRRHDGPRTRPALEAAIVQARALQGTDQLMAE
jgi:protein-disulfide isomerase